MGSPGWGTEPHVTRVKKPPVLGALRTVGRSSRRRLARLSTAELLDGYLLSKRASGKAPATIETARTRIGRMIRALGDPTASEIHVDDVRQWLVAMKQGRTGRPTSDVYVENHRKEAAAFFTWAVRERHLSRSPMATIEKYRVTRPAIHTLTREEIALLIDQQPDTHEGMRNAAILAFMYDTAVRVGELVKIRLEDVDLAAAQVRIEGKNRRVESVPISPKLRSILWTYISRARPRELFAGTAQLFVARDGGPVTTNAVRLWMRRAGDRAHIVDKRVSPHVIRASAATHFAANGVSAFGVQRFLRHRTSTMSQRYVDLSQIDFERQYAAASPLQHLKRGA